MKRMLTEAVIAGLFATLLHQSVQAQQPTFNNDYNKYLEGYKAGYTEYASKGACADDETHGPDYQMGKKDACSKAKRDIRKAFRRKAVIEALK